VFAAINTAATFPRVASADAGCPGFNGNFATLAAVPNIPDPRCANNFQAAGPFRNNGTAPLKSTLEAWGSSLNLTYNPTEAVGLKSISAYRNVRWTEIAMRTTRRSQFLTQPMMSTAGRPARSCRPSIA